MTPLRASLHTLGCRLNQAETATISATFAARGYAIVEYGAETDVCVINTCSVTEGVEAKCRQAVRAVLRHSPDAYVVVTGCYAQVGVEVLRRMTGVDLIVGTEHKMQVAELVDVPQKSSQPRVVHSQKISRGDFIVEGVGLYTGHTRANLKIQDGCNFACAFCIIPFTRGGARSRKLDDIVREAHGLVAHGHRELVLTGVNIGTYTSEGHDLLRVIQALERIDGLERLRISSIEPTTVSEAVVEWMATSSKLCPYLHVPVQSGDDQVLHAAVAKRLLYEIDRALVVVRLAARECEPKPLLGETIAHLGGHRELLRDRLFDILYTMNPEEIFVSSVIDNHPDHRVLAELGHELARARRDRVPVLYEYPIWFWDLRIWRVRKLLELRTRIVRTEQFLTRKREAIAAYRSQVTNWIDETGSAPLRKGFLRQFLQPEEIFFEVGTSV